MLCPDLPAVIIQFRQLALTTSSVPAMILVPVYLAFFGFHSLRAGLLGRRDITLWLGLSILQAFVAIAALTAAGTELNVYFLTWPFLIFMLVYGWQRKAGYRPLAAWPWHRFGLLLTLTMLTTDILVALSLPSSATTVWQLGGACLLDALVIAPPLLALAYFGLLDCRSPMVVCSNQCVTIDRCRFGMDGKGCADEGEEGKPAFAFMHAIAAGLRPLGRITTAVCLGLAIVLMVEGATKHEEAPQDAVLANPALKPKLQGELASLAAKYAIPVPQIHLAQTPVAGVTIRPEKDVATLPSTIQIGDPLLKGRFLEEPDLLRAAVVHEFGHAVKIARGEKFPLELLVLWIALPMMVILVAFPTFRGMLAAAAAQFVVVLLMIKLLDLRQDIAVRNMVYGWCLIAGSEMFYGRSFRTHFATVAKMAKSHLVVAHMPSRRGLFISAAIAIVAFFGIGFNVGKLNNQAEFDCDMMAACEVGPRVMARTLTGLVGRPMLPGDEFMGRLFDPFHPPIMERITRLEAMQADPSRMACHGDVKP